MEYSYNYEMTGWFTNTTLLMIITCILILSFLFMIFMLVSMWKIYKKAGKKGWEVIVPIYSNIVLFEIIGYAWWHVLIMMFIPVALMVYSILIPLELAKKFNQKTGFGLILLFFPFIGYPLLAFGDYRYNNTNGEGNIDYTDGVVQKDYSSKNVNNEDHYYNAELASMSQEQINQMVAQQVQENNLKDDEFNESFKEIEEEKADVKTCPVCGNNIGVTLNECFMCGHLFE